MATLSSEDARRRLEALPGWELQGNAIRRQFTFGDFAEAVSFVVRLGFAAEVRDHHPDVLINYRRVTLTFTTHSAGGLTTRDFDGAEEATRLAQPFEGQARS